VSDNETFICHIQCGDSVSGISLRVSPDAMPDLVAVCLVYRLNKHRSETSFNITSLKSMERRIQEG